MAKYIVLDWEAGRLRVLAATLQRGNVRVTRAGSWEEAGTPNPAEAEALGVRLRERLREARIGAAPVIACVGRDRVIVKDVRYPAAGATEEPALVRFQVVKELTDAADEVVLDYARLADEGGGERRAVAFVLRKELLAAYQTLCRSAGLKLEALAPRTFGTLGCLERLGGGAGVAEGVAGVVTVAKPWAEFAVVRGDALVFTRSLTAGPALAGEVRRNLVVYAGQSPQHPVSGLFVVNGGPEAPVLPQFQQLMAVPVRDLDPWAALASAEAGGALAPEERGSFSAGLGLLYLLARRPLPVNFVRPKQPGPARKADRGRIVAAAAAAAVLLGVVGYCYSRLAARDRELDALLAQESDLDLQLGKMEDTSKRLKALEEWDGKSIDWLDELYDLTSYVDEPDGLRLTEVAANPLDNKNKPRLAARMTLKGVTQNDRRAVDQMVAELERDGHYRVEFPPPSRNTGVERFNFPLQFVSHVDVERKPPGQFRRQLPEGPPQPRRRGGADFGGFGGDGP